MKSWFSRMLGPQALADCERTQTRFYSGLAIALIVLGWILPEDLLSKHGSLQAFCNLVAAVVPQIDIITRLGIRPDANRLYYSILWLLSVPFFVMFYLSGRANFSRGLVKPLSASRAVILVLGLSFGAAFCMFLWYGVGAMSSMDWKVRAMFSLPVLREVSAVVLVFGFWACVSGVLIAAEQLYSRFTSSA